jgi:adenylate kinase
MRIILLGPPGSGKGTQGDMMQKKFGFPKISTGDLLRQGVKEGTPFGKKAESFMNRGELVSDDIVIGMVSERILKEDCSNGYILDGFPRNILQAEELDRMDASRREIALYIHLEDQVIIDRLTMRRICSDCGEIYNLHQHKPTKEDKCDVCQGSLIQREDDRVEVIKERLRVYREKTEGLLDHYKTKKVLHKINGDGNIEEIFDQISSVLDCEFSKPESRETAP